VASSINNIIMEIKEKEEYDKILKEVVKRLEMSRSFWDLPITIDGLQRTSHYISSSNHYYS